MYEAPYTDEQCCKEDAASEHQGADTLNHKWLDELMSVLARQILRWGLGSRGSGVRNPSVQRVKARLGFHMLLNQKLLDQKQRLLFHEKLETFSFLLIHVWHL